MTVSPSIGATLPGAFLGRKTVSAATVARAGTAVRSMGRAYKESQDVARASETLEAMEQQRAGLEAEFQAEAAALQSSLDPLSAALETIVIRPKKTAIAVRLVTLAWAPYRDNQPAWSCNLGVDSHAVTKGARARLSRGRQA